MHVTSTNPLCYLGPKLYPPQDSNCGTLTFPVILESKHIWGMVFWSSHMKSYMWILFLCGRYIYEKRWFAHIACPRGHWAGSLQSSISHFFKWNLGSRKVHCSKIKTRMSLQNPLVAFMARRSFKQLRINYYLIKFGIGNTHTIMAQFTLNSILKIQIKCTYCMCENRGLKSGNECHSENHQVNILSTEKSKIKQECGFSTHVPGLHVWITWNIKLLESESLRKPDVSDKL